MRRKRHAVPLPTTRLRAEPGPDDNPAPVEDDRLLEILEHWEEHYRRDEDVSPESLGVADPELMEALPTADPYRQEALRIHEVRVDRGRDRTEGISVPPGARPSPTDQRPSSAFRRSPRLTSGVTG